jgi:hypothetical protein
MTTEDADDEIARHRSRLLAVLVDLNQAVEKMLVLTAMLPHQILNLESLAADSVSAAWRIRARVLEAFAAIVVLEDGLPMARTDSNGQLMRLPPTPSEVIDRTRHAAGSANGEESGHMT